MRFFHPPNQPHLRAGVNDDNGPLRSLELSLRGGSFDAESRHEPQVLTSRIVPVDPYKAWLAEREAEHGESEPVRWIVR
jgi:hypothetical protein